MWNTRELHVKLSDLEFQNLHGGLPLKNTSWGSHTPMPFFDSYVYLSASDEVYILEKSITRKSPAYRSDTKHSATVRVISPNEELCDKIIRGIEQKVKAAL